MPAHFAREPRARYPVQPLEIPTTLRLLIDTPGVKIATCPLVENGVIRVLNLPNYGRGGA